MKIPASLKRLELSERLDFYAKIISILVSFIGVLAAIAAVFFAKSIGEDQVRITKKQLDLGTQQTEIARRSLNVTSFQLVDRAESFLGWTEENPERVRECQLKTYRTSTEQRKFKHIGSGASIQWVAGVVQRDPEQGVELLTSLLLSEESSVVAAALVVLSKTMGTDADDDFYSVSLTMPDDNVSQEREVQARVKKMIARLGPDFTVNIGGVYLQNSDFRALKRLGLLRMADFSGACLVGVDFSGLDLEYTNFSNAILRGVKFNEVALESSVWINAVVRESVFKGAVMDYSLLAEGDFSGWTPGVGTGLFGYNSFDGASLVESVLSGSYFLSARFCNASLEGARVVGAKFYGIRVDVGTKGACVVLKNADILRQKGVRYAENIDLFPPPK